MPKSENSIQSFENMTIEVVGTKVVITIIDHTLESGLSASGKSKTVASTRGNVVLASANGLSIGINAYRKV